MAKAGGQNEQWKNAANPPRHFSIKLLSYKTIPLVLHQPPPLQPSGSSSGMASYLSAK